MTEPGQLELRVLRGLHAGAALPLHLQTLTIGSSEDCDVVLLDDGVEPVHVSLECIDGVWCHRAGGAVVELGIPIPVGDAAIAICIEGMPLLPFHERAPASPAVPDAAHRAAVRLPAVTAPATLVRVGLPMVGAGLLMIVALAAALVCIFWTPDVPGPERPALPPAVAAASAESLESEGELLVRRLDLGAEVRVSAQAGRLGFTATLEPADRSRLETAVNALAQRLGRRAVVELALTTAAPAPAPAFTVREMVIGAASHVTLSDGRRIFEGQTLGRQQLVRVSPTVLAFVERPAAASPN